MDSIIKDYATTELSEPDNITFVQKQIIKRTYGFHYEENFRPMLMRLIGLVILERLETLLTSSGDLQILSTQLDALKTKRNNAAHTTITGVTITYDAPSIVKGYLNRIHPILNKLETELIKTKTGATTSVTKKGCFVPFGIVILLSILYFLL